MMRDAELRRISAIAMREHNIRERAQLKDRRAKRKQSRASRKKNKH